MPLPNLLRRRWLRCACGAAVLLAAPILRADPTPGDESIDRQAPQTQKRQPVSTESATPGAFAEELDNPPVRMPRTAAPRADRPAVLQFDGAEARYEMLAGDELGMDVVTGGATLTFADLEAFSIKPRAEILFADGPTRTDLPGRLYSGELEFRWFKRVAKPVFVELAFIPGLFTDGDALGGDALRLQGRGVGYLALSEETQFALGATYLDREDVPLLPIVGMIHSPREDWRWEIMFPRPRVSKRIAQDSAGESWLHLSGELGGGAWAIERTDGRSDIANYRDYRLVAGWERQFAEGGSGTLEAGYIFGRELTYDSGWGDFDPSGTFLVRCGLSR